MKHKLDGKNLPCKVISFKNYKDKKIKKVSTTIAAIIAIKIEHPSNTTPEDFFISEIESIDKFEILAFEDALQNNIGLTTTEAQNGAINDA